MTSKARYHLAQANIALGLGPLTDPVMSGFVEQLEYINSVADRADGFVWRYQTEEGDATDTRVFDDPLILFNMSVWESVEHLYDHDPTPEAFTFATLFSPRGRRVPRGERMDRECGV